MKRSTLIIFVLTALFIFSCSEEENEPRTSEDYSDILSIKNLPESFTDDSPFAFFDLGSWTGYALPPDSLTENRFSIAGPFLMEGRIWLGRKFLQLYISDNDGTEIPFSNLKNYRSEYLPGILRQSAEFGRLKITQEMFFLSSETAVVSVYFKNTKAESHTFTAGFRCGLFEKAGSFGFQNGLARISASNGQTVFVSPPQGFEILPAKNSACFKTHNSKRFNLGPVSSEEIFAAISTDSLFSGARFSAKDFAEARAKNRLRWNGYIASVEESLLPNFASREYRELAVKSVLTLISNWKAPVGGLKHSGIIPSYAINYFNGFWAWDSWKHAVAAVLFDPKLAKDQVRAMFDYQNSAGMIPDVIYADTTENNWRDTKPPLAAWAVSAIFEQTGDKKFVEELYPKLKKYHYWWRQNRDHDENGLCEYGSTDGTLIAAKWESGMDNAVRFDHAEMVQNSESAWSVNIESVDLNSYLYAEKIFLSELAEALGNYSDKEKFLAESDTLKSKINSLMFDQESGYYFDIDLTTKNKILTAGPEGWIPLWAGAADEYKAERVRKTILDKNLFNTFVPFPTVNKSSPEYSLGYWRGPVWLDQAYFGIAGLKKFGYSEEAETLASKLIRNSEGLLNSNLPIRENYSPETGEGLNVKHFSWSAAHLLLMISENIQNENQN